jgi:amino acid adenylation domain-containing protein
MNVADLSPTEPVQEAQDDSWRDYPGDRCFHQLFEAQVERTPDAVAVIFENEHLTYQELNKKANQLAHYLRQLGVGPEVLVGLYMERSLDIVVGLLGILKAGGAYVPLDPSLPPERIAYMLADSQAPVLVTQQSLKAGLPEHKAYIISIDTDWSAITCESEENPISGVKGENLVYVIYTSGSTGRPKGVAVEHRQLLNYLNGILERLEIPAGCSFATLSTLATDLGNTAIFPALGTGGCLHVISQARIIDAHALVDYFEHHPIDCLKITPSHLAALQASSQTKPIMPLRRLIIGGEASKWEWVKKLQAFAPDCVILNHYGPTETTVGVLTFQVKKEQDELAYTMTPLGRPLANTQVYILDQYCNPVPGGVSGEIYIGGASVARGYLNQPELTAEKFIPDPFSAQPGARLYKTGDLARYLPDGNIEFLGRLDDQIKLRGFRIELREIEVVLSQHPAVQQAVVIAREDVPGDKRLVSYVVLRKDQLASVEDLKDQVAKQLPAYMVPSAFVLLEAFPLTPNGKVDRRALPAPELTRRTSEQRFVPATLPVQRQLVQIWQELLHVQPIGITDNFFELGGHSLLAAQMVARIEAVCGQRLPVSTLFAGPTIAHLAEVLQEGDASPIHAATHPRAPLVPVHPEGSRRPFFYLHGDWMGGSFYCITLAASLEADQPFYILEPYIFEGLQSLPTFAEMAAAHIQSMRAIQPEGPYLLGGFCNGGLLAYEMARQLEAAGQQVELLVLINPLAPTPRNAAHRLIRRMSRLLHISEAQQVELFLLYQYLHRLWEHYSTRFLKSGQWKAEHQKRKRKSMGFLLRKLTSLIPTYEILHKDWMGFFHWIAGDYKAGPYPGKIAFLWTTDDFARNRDWQKLTAANDVSLYIIPGTHRSCRGKDLSGFAQQLKACLDEVQVMGRL